MRTKLGADSEPERWSTLVHPGLPMPRTAQDVHGISDEQLIGAPPWAAVHEDLKARLEGAVLVAHNAAFDIGFIEAEASRAGLPSPVPSAVLCTLTLARRIYGFHSCSLLALASRAGIPQPVAHRALADADTTLGVLRALVEGLSLDGRAPALAALLLRIESMRKSGPGRVEIRAGIEEALVEQRDVTIDYTARSGHGPFTTRRRITPTGLTDTRFEGWCHLREAQRTFHLKCVQRLVGA